MIFFNTFFLTKKRNRKEPQHAYKNKNKHKKYCRKLAKKMEWTKYRQNISMAFLKKHQGARKSTIIPFRFIDLQNIFLYVWL